MDEKVKAEISKSSLMVASSIPSSDRDSSETESDRSNSKAPPLVHRAAPQFHAQESRNETTYDTYDIAGSSEHLQARAPAISAREQIETAAAELEDGSQIDIIEDPRDSTRSLLAVFRHGEVHITDRFESENRIFIPIPRTTTLLRHIRLPLGVERCWNETFLLGEIFGLLQKCLDLNPCDLLLLAHFVLSTWLVEQLSIAPYIAFVGLPGTGKSTALSVLSLLCRRSLLTTNITSAAFIGSVIDSPRRF